MKTLMKSYKYRIFPTKLQEQLLSQEMFIANQVYNITLSLLKKQNQDYKNYLKHFENMNKFFNTSVKPMKRRKYTDAELDRLVKSILKSRNLKGETDTRQQERSISKRAYFDGFKEKGFSKFHRYSVNQGAFSGVNARTKLGENWMLMSKRIGKIKMKRERLFPENTKLKTVRIKKENNKYYAIFGIEFLEKFEKKIDDFVGYSEEFILGADTNSGHIDFSDGTVINYQRNFNEKELKRLMNKGKNKKTNHQKRLTKLFNEFKNIEKLKKKQSKRIEKAKKNKTKLGVNYKKDRLKLAKIQEKQKNRRKNLLDKVSNEILSKAFSVLFLEDLNVKKMTKKKNGSKGMSKEKNKSMRKNILNFSYSTLHSMLKYKAMHLDRLVLFVDPAYTTQECSCCGKRNKMKLSDRIYSCDCGFSLDRDWNSAINIRSRGINLFEELNSSCLAA